MNRELLHTELQNERYVGKTALECADLLNAQTIAVDGPVSTVAISDYLQETRSSVLTPLSLYNVLTATYQNKTAFDEPVRLIAENIIDLATSVERKLNLRKRDPDDPLAPNQYELGFGLLVQEGRYTRAEADAVLNLGRSFISRAQQLLGESVTEANVRAARLYPKSLQVQSLRDASAQQVAVYESQLADLSAGIDVEVA